MAEKQIPGWVREESTISAATPFQVSQGDKDLSEAALNKEALDTGFFETVGSAFKSGDNAAVQLFYDMDRIDKSGPEDPQWKTGGADEWLKSNGKDIPPDQTWRYLQTKNGVEAQLMLDDFHYNKSQQEKIGRRFNVSPVSTFTAIALAGLIDVDAPITLLTGGLSATAKIGLNATKIGRLMSGAAAGALTGMGVQETAYLSNPNEDWTSVPLAGLGGAAFGTIGGALGGPAGRLAPESAANDARLKTLDEFGETLHEGAPRAHEDIRKEVHTHTDPYRSEAMRQAELEDAAAPAPKAAESAPRSPQAIKLEETEKATEELLSDAVPEDAPIEGRSTVGARQTTNTGPGLASIRSTRVQDIITNARQRNTQIGVEREWFDNTSKLDQVNAGLGKAARRFNDFVQATPLATDFAKFMRSGSAVAQMFAYDMLENASGIVRNNRSGAALMDHYQKTMLGDFLPYHDAFDEFAGRVHGATGAKGIWRKITDTKMRQDFNAQIIEELNARNYGYKSTVPDPAVSRAADAIDNTFKREIEISAGRPGEGQVKGYDTLTPKSGYFPQKWVGSKMQQLINSGKFGTGAAGKKAIVTAIKEAYQNLHPAMSPKDAEIWADAVVTRALTTNEGISMNLVGILKDNDGRQALEDILQRNGATPAEITRVIDKITGTKEEAGRAGHTKHRLDADMRFTASNGIKLMDLVDTDINKIVAQRARKSAGAAALARKGIYSRADLDEIREVILKEQEANGPAIPSGSKVDDFLDNNKHLTAQDIDDMFSYFLGQPIAGGISPTYSRMRKITNLSLLNQLGLTQLAELGPTIAAVGWKEFSRIAGREVMDSLKKQDSPLVQELKHMNIFIPEEKMFRDDLTFEYEKLSGGTSEYMRTFDNWLNKGQRLQGYTSGFYAVRKIQQRIAVTTGVDKVVKGLRDGSMSPDRLRDIGFDPALMKSVKDYINNGTVSFDADGNVTKLNLDKWTPEDAENFALTMNRNVNQLVQKAMAGESSMIFHRDGVASLFWHLKSFPMLAMEKQTLRNARMADGEAMATFMYGLVTAGAAYTIKQTINGRTDNLDPVNVAKQAFGLSNMTGWIPMWIDPLAGMLGMDGYKLNGYGSYGGNSVLSVPAALGTLDRLLQAPMSALNVINPFVEASNGDIRNLQALPIIGNAVGFTLMFNALKDSPADLERKRRARKKEAEAFNAPEAALDKANESEPMFEGLSGLLLN